MHLCFRISIEQHSWRMVIFHVLFRFWISCYKWNLALVTQDSIIAFQNFLIFIIKAVTYNARPKMKRDTWQKSSLFLRKRTALSGISLHFRLFIVCCSLYCWCYLTFELTLFFSFKATFTYLIQIAILDWWFTPVRLFLLMFFLLYEEVLELHFWVLCDLW